jgi:hypothetical protein
VVALLAVHGLLLALSIPRNAVTFDEVAHLPAGISYWQRGEFWAYHHNPPLVRLLYALPAVLVDVPMDYQNFHYRPGVRQPDNDLGRDFMLLNRDQYMAIFVMCRMVVAGLSVLGGYMVFCWSRELWGSAGGLVSLALWAFSPNVLAHAGLVTPDVGATVIGFGATYVFWRYLRRPSLWGACLSGILLGLAEAAKFSLVVLPLAWALFATVKVYCSRGRRGEVYPHPPPQSQTERGGDSNALAAGRAVVHAGIVLLVSLLVLNDVYLFEGTGRRLGSFELRSKTLTAEEPSSQKHRAQLPAPRVNQFRGTFWENLPMPLPEQYALGLDDQMFDVDCGGFWNYLRGVGQVGRGWWYYYLYCALVKGPLGTLFLVVAATVAALVKSGTGAAPTAPLAQVNPVSGSGPVSVFRADGVSEAAIFAPMVIFFATVSAGTALNSHFRYALPAFPFAFVYVGRLGGLWSARSSALRRQTAFRLKLGLRTSLKVVVVAALAGNAASVLRVHPHYLTYFNEAAGGPLHALDHLADSNIDWGQGLLALRDWLARHAPGKKICLAYFGAMYPEVLGIDYELPSAEGPAPGLQAVSANYLLGCPSSPPSGHWSRAHVPRAAFVYYRRFRPIAVPGNSIYVYDLGLEEVNIVRREMGLPLFKP